MDTVNAGFSISAIITGCFTFLIGGMIYTAKRWIDSTTERMDEHELRLDDGDRKVIILEQGYQYHHKQINTVTGQLLNMAQELARIDRATARLPDIDKKLDRLLERQ